MGNRQVWFETNDKTVPFTYFHSWSTFKDYPMTGDRYTYGRYEINAIRLSDVRNNTDVYVKSFLYLIFCNFQIFFDSILRGGEGSNSLLSVLSAY